MAGTLGRLYSGTGALDVVGRRRIWYSVSGLLVAICILSMLLRGFNLGIDFEGGTRVQLPAQGATGAISTMAFESNIGAAKFGRPNHAAAPILEKSIAGPWPIWFAAT